MIFNRKAASMGMTVFYFICLLMPATAIARDDWQYWHSYQLKWDTVKDIAVRIEGEQRLRDDFSDSFLGNIQAGFLWGPSKYFDIGPFFKYERSKNARGRHTDENRWLIEANLKLKLGKLGIQDRNRIAYRNRNTFDSWRYRNRVKLFYEIPVKRMKLEPFVSEELFYESDTAFDQNRIQLGLTSHFGRHLSMTLYYMLQSKKAGRDWNEAHVLGTAMGINL